MAAPFLPLIAYGLAEPVSIGPDVLLAAVVGYTMLLTLGSALSLPFGMDTIVGLSGDRLVATHYGLYNTVDGVGIALGNLFSGALLDAAGSGPLPWITLAAIGAGCGAAVRLLSRNGRLTPAQQPAPATGGGGPCGGHTSASLQPVVRNG